MVSFLKCEGPLFRSHTSMHTRCHAGIPGYVRIVQSDDDLLAVQLTNSAGWKALVKLFVSANTGIQLV